MSREPMSGMECLAAAARAFTRAQRSGLVWIDEQTGMFDTVESELLYVAPEPANPDQLRLA